MPTTIEFMQEEGRMLLVLSNKKDSYYVVTASKCSCPSATYRGGQCKHMRRFFPHVAKPVADDNVSIRPDGTWRGGANGPVDEIPGVA